MAIIARAEEVRYARQKSILPVKTGVQRFLLEAPFNLIGLLMRGVMELLPAELVLKGHEKLFRQLASPRHYPFDPASPALEASRALARRVEAETGLRPAMLALISHPPVMGEMAHLNFELVRHAILALRELRGEACRPRLVVAVDPFALDTVSMATEGLYAGYMGTYHVGIDRMALERGGVSRALLKEAAWHRMAYRLLGLLRSGREVGMVLSGGVPSTTRALYVTKEWLASQRAQSALKSRPSEALKRLLDCPGFANFRAPAGAPRGAWRAMEAYLASALTGALGDGGRPELPSADTGRMTGPARQAAQDCLEALGFRPPQAQIALELLSEEVGRETPYRARFFRILAGRVLKKGTPLIFIPIAHRVGAGGEMAVAVKPAWAWTGWRGGVIKARGTGLPGEPSAQWEGSAEAFAARFVRENFS